MSQNMMEDKDKFLLTTAKADVYQNKVMVFVIIGGITGEIISL